MNMSETMLIRADVDGLYTRHLEQIFGRAARMDVPGGAPLS